MWLKQGVGLGAKRRLHLFDRFPCNLSGVLPNMGGNVWWKPERLFMVDCIRLN